MSQSIILELQELATDHTTDVMDLLRKAYLVATKLNLTDFRNWVDYELNGYDSSKAEVPLYRKVTTELKVRVPFGGIKPLYVDDPELAKMICEVHYQHPIKSIVSVIDQLKQNPGNQGRVQIPFSAEHRDILLRWLNYEAEPLRTIGDSQLEMIVDAVRSMVLDWALRLEQEGIVGEGLSFSREEKEIAARSPQIHITNFQGVLGDVQDSIVHQTLNMNVVTGDFESLRKMLLTEGVPVEEVDSLKVAIDNDPLPEKKGFFGPQVNAWLGKAVAMISAGAWTVGTGAGGKFLADALSAYYGF